MFGTRSRRPSATRSEDAVLELGIALAHTQILGQITDEAGLDSRTMGLLGFAGALFGGDIATRASLDGLSWAALVPIGAAVLLCLWSVLASTSELGPKASRFIARFGHTDPNLARRQLLIDMNASFDRNERRIRAKTIRLRWATGALATGLLLLAMLLAV